LVLGGITFNVVLYLYLHNKRQERRAMELKKIMDQNEAIAMSQRMNQFAMQSAGGLGSGNLDPTQPSAMAPHMIYVDNKMVLEN
jgi:hypothetical protein